MKISVVYVSAAQWLFGDHELALLLDQSVANNERSGITGLLLYMSGNFMQAIEGEERHVEALFDAIAADPRHSGMTTLLKTSTEERQFPDWSMGFVNMERLRRTDQRGFSDFLTRNFINKAALPNHESWQLLQSFRNTMR